MMASFIMMLNPAAIALAAAAMLIFMVAFLGILAYANGMDEECFLSGFIVGVSAGALLSGVGVGALITYELAAITGAIILIEAIRDNPPNANVCLSS